MFSSMISKFFGRKIDAEEKQTTHTVEVNWDDWSPPGENDGILPHSLSYTAATPYFRSPCPALNSLANHSILPHNGKAITKSMAIAALTQALHLDPKIASIFAAGGVAANPDHDAHSFDLNHVSKHGYIEHDVSLSRDDAAFHAGPEKFSPEAWETVLEVYRTAHGGAKKGDEEIVTDWASAGRARWTRVQSSKEKHEREGKGWTYGVKEAIMSYGETSLYLNLLGKDGVAPLRWVRVFFEEERLPYKEGWRPPVKLDQADLNHGFAEMMKSGEHGVEEAKWVGLGTLAALKAAILGLGASFIKTPSALS
ncbi:Cloroperoxidase [Bimuria novae-zelandiae CBS 107.79]|uniref:Cloroperoxidase n=1 Tax=Bimuria novae-zelandiae CBS 107.79 TaxID=1447943 RepID=A0A6A5UYM1_9PLEO|nr:Cloroperoxidase [Bimuria novae-zelandiae CBS 107.79]